MKFKLDENFGTRTQQIFRTKGLDVLTVRDQHLQGCADQRLFEVCCSEKRCLVTLDLDFSDVLRFPPHHAYGIVVIRVPHNSTLLLLERGNNRQDIVQDDEDFEKYMDLLSRYKEKYKFKH